MTQTDPTTLDEDAEEMDDDAFAALRKKAAKADAAEQANADLARENAMLKAGVDLSTPIGLMFSKGYDGELTKEAVEAAYLTVTGDPAPEPENVIPEAERALAGERSSLAAGATGDTGAAPTKPVGGKDGEAVKSFQTAMDAGLTRDEAAGAAFQTLVQAGAAGDTSVLLPRGGGNRE